jgi:putative addiction module killer protein
MIKFEVEVYETAQGKLPFDEWLNSLADVYARQKIRVRLERVSLGNFGDFEPVQVKVFMNLRYILGQVIEFTIHK